MDHHDPHHPNPADEQIGRDDFARVDLRLGTVLHAAPNAGARKAAYVLEVDLGPLGTRRSSAQITDRYAPADLIGRQVLCVTNLPPLRVAGVRSEVLVTGFAGVDGIVLATADGPVPNGSRLV